MTHSGEQQSRNAPTNGDSVVLRKNNRLDLHSGRLFWFHLDFTFGRFAVSFKRSIFKTPVKK